MYNGYAVKCECSLDKGNLYIDGVFEDISCLSPKNARRQALKRCREINEDIDFVKAVVKRVVILEV